MRLRRSQTKKDQALDLVATAAKSWSEWQLAKTATKGVRKGAHAAAEAKDRMSARKALAGAVVATGIGAVVAGKLKRRSGAVPAYSPPVQPTVPRGATPAAPLMDVDAPNESAPGHHPEGEQAARS